ncbi:hypothetical protein ES707_19107 [subsurface metagenome]
MDELKRLSILIVLLVLFGSAMSGILLGYLELAFNYTAYVSFLVDSFIFVIIGIILYFTVTVVTISIPISNIGRYHHSNPESETETAIIKNSKIVLKNNLILTLPLYFSIMYLRSS